MTGTRAPHSIGPPSMLTGALKGPRRELQYGDRSSTEKPGRVAKEEAEVQGRSIKGRPSGKQQGREGNPDPRFARPAFQK